MIFGSFNNDEGLSMRELIFFNDCCRVGTGFDNFNDTEMSSKV